MAKRLPTDPPHRIPDDAASAPRPAGLLPSRLMVVVAGVFLFCVLMMVYTDTRLGEVMLAVVREGVLCAAWAGSAAMLGYVVLRWAKVEVAGALGFATAAGLGLGVYSLCALGLGLTGWLNRWTAVGMGVAAMANWAVAKLLAHGKPHCDLERPHPNPLPEGEGEGRLGRSLALPARWEWLWLLAVPSLVIAVVGACLVPGWLWKPLDPHPYDVMAYHLQAPREWYQAGRIVPLGYNIYSHFPFNVEMHYLLAMHVRGGPWEGMYLAQFMSVTFMVLTVVAVAGAVGKAGGVVAGVLVASVPWVIMLSPVAYVEGGMMLYAVLVVGWVMRGVWGTGGPPVLRCFAVAGVMAGLACGVKYTAFPAVLMGVPLALGVVMLWHGRAARATESRAGSPCHIGLVKPMLVFTAAGIVSFGPWLVRNWVWTGNPVFPMAMRLLGHDGLSEVQIERWDRAHRAPVDLRPLGRRGKAVWTRVVADWQYGYVLVSAFVLAAAMMWRRREAWFLVVLLLIQLIFWMGFTHMAGRFAVLIVPLAAMMVGMAVATRPWIGAIVVVIAVSLGLWRMHQPPPMAVAGGTMELKGFGYHAMMGREGLFLLHDLMPFNPQEIQLALENPNTKLALIGNSQAFFQQLPMSRLDYRIIFNIDFPKDKNVLNAWLGRDIETLRQEGYVVVIHPDEIRRLAATYWQVPVLPAEWAGREEAVILPPK